MVPERGRAWSSTTHEARRGLNAMDSMEEPWSAIESLVPS